jgi:hypothetical protein
MYSNSKDQKSIEDLYSKILSEDFETSHEAEARPVHPEETSSNVPTSGDSVKDKVKNLIKSGKLSSVNTEDEDHINSLLAEFGLSDEAPEEDESASHDAESDFSSENEEKSFYPQEESYNTASYLSAAGKKKQIVNESSSSTSHYMPKKK